MSTTASSSDDDFLSKLPDDILLQIITKLPERALIQLIAVSKQFKTLIRNPQFLEAHLSSIETGPKHFLSYRYGRLSRYCSANYSWNSIRAQLNLPLFRQLELVGNSVRGVLCLRPDENQYSSVDTILWNPSILRYRIVPSTFTHSTWHVYYGFGFDQVNFDFKVVKLIYKSWLSCIDMEAMVYVVKSGCWWRRIGHKVPRGVDIVHGHSSVFVNGIVYWLALSHDSVNGDGHDCIMGFDLANEVFKVTKLPLEFSVFCLPLSTSSDGKSLVFFHNLGGISRQFSTNWGVSYFTDCIWEKRYNLVLGYHIRPLLILNDEDGEVLAEFGNGNQCVVNGVKVGAVRSAVTNVNPAAGSSEFGYTTYTPSLAFLLDDSAQVE